MPNFRTNYGKHAFKIAIIKIWEEILIDRSLRTIAKKAATNPTHVLIGSLPFLVLTSIWDRISYLRCVLC